MSDAYPSIDPNTIVINRNTRQRQENITDIDDLVQSLSAIGLINPIVVRRENNNIFLVSGERRLTAAMKLGWTSVPVRFIEDLQPREAEVLELEENIKRKELHWKDQVKAIGRIHQLYKQKDETWTINQTAENISLHHTQVRKILHVFAALGTGRIDGADSIEQAYNTLQRFAERKAAAIVTDLVVKGAEVFGNKEEATQSETTAEDDGGDDDLSDEAIFAEFANIEATTTSSSSINIDDLLTSETASNTGSAKVVGTVLSSDPIQNLSFIEWAKTYSGPKFSLIHCDFPYGNYKGNDSKGAMSTLDTDDFYDNHESIYWDLLSALTDNLDRIMSYSSHLVFWFNMNFYTETVRRLRAAGLNVHDHPLIWHKTSGLGGLGVAVGTEATHPRRTYDTALMAVRGNRPLVRSQCNSYAAPTVGNKIHPSQKSEPMLRYFLQMFVDETASVLDPTCGSAAALRAAEALGAQRILGLELDPNYAMSANAKTLHARILRQAGALRKED